MTLDAASTMGVAVIIPTYNRADLLPDAVQSVVDQGPEVREIIIVDDGSTDNTAEVVKTLRDARVRYVVQSQRGPAAARDHGLSMAQSPFVMYLDSDDMLEKGAVSHLLEARRAQPDKVPFGRASVHTETPFRPPDFDFSIAERSGVLLPELAFYSGGTIFAALYPKELLERIGGFADCKCSHDCEDYDLALRLAPEVEFFYIPKTVYRVRMHAGNRHRFARLKVWACQRDAAGERLDRPGMRLLRRRVMASFNGCIAMCLLEDGHPGQAAKEFVRCLVLWPVKLGAWRGLVKSLLAALRGGKS